MLMTQLIYVASAMALGGLAGHSLNRSKFAIIAGVVLGAFTGTVLVLLAVQMISPSR